jgi:hypothetical protein
MRIVTANPEDAEDAEPYRGGRGDTKSTLRGRYATLGELLDEEGGAAAPPDRAIDTAVRMF